MADEPKRKPEPLSQECRERIHQFSQSDLFAKLFDEGMGLVEETATYLDGKGREESRTLQREASLSYATVSMETTTRLMQAASWLVVQRAVKEGDMSPDEAGDDKFRLDVEPFESLTSDRRQELPDGLIELVDRSAQLFDRIQRLDKKVYRDDAPHPGNPVQDQLTVLQKAADTGAFDPLAVWRRGT